MLKEVRLFSSSIHTAKQKAGTGGFTQHYFSHTKSSAGFTLIELLVVISIISLLSSVVLTSTRAARENAREVVRTLDIRQVKTALEFYLDDNNETYPTAGKNANITFNLTDLGPELAPYVRSMPEDPIYTGTSDYQYVWGKNPHGYGIRIRYEKGGFCKTGVRVKAAWWGASTPFCGF